MVIQPGWGGRAPGPALNSRRSRRCVHTPAAFPSAGLMPGLPRGAPGSESSRAKIKLFSKADKTLRLGSHLPGCQTPHTSCSLRALAMIHHNALHCCQRLKSRQHACRRPGDGIHDSAIGMHAVSHVQPPSPSAKFYSGLPTGTEENLSRISPSAKFYSGLPLGRDRATR